MSAGSSAFAKLLGAKPRLEVVQPEQPTEPAPGLDECMRFLAGHDQDYARELNGVGFSKFDAERGHRLASLPLERWSEWDRIWAWERTRYYHRQFEAAGIRFDLIPRPPQPKKPEPVREMKLRPDGWVAIHYAHLPGDEFIRTRNLAREIPGRQFVGTEEATWLIPPDGESARGLREFCVAAGWIPPADVTTQIEKLVDRAPRLIALSRSVEPSESMVRRIAELELKRELWLPQISGCEYLEEAGWRCLIGDEMGTGKTALALAAAKLAGCFDTDREDERYGLLIVCPATLRPNWAREAEAVLGMKATVINGTSVQKLAGPIVVVNYDVFWEDSPVWELAVSRDAMRGWAGIICDESHYLKNPDAKRTLGVKKLLEASEEIDEQGIPFRLMLTGSPILNRVTEFVPQLAMIGLLQHFGGEYRFRGAYANPYDTHRLKELNQKLREVGYLSRLKDHHAFGPVGQFLHINDVPEAIAPADLRHRSMDDEEDKALVERLRRHMAQYGWELVEGSMKLPPKVRVVHDLPIDNRKEYDRAMREFRNWLWEQLMNVDGGMAAFQRMMRAEILVRIEKLKQLCVRGKQRAALAWIEEFLSETDRKLVIFVEHDFAQEAIHAEFGEVAAIITGGQSMERRQAEIDRFQGDPNCRLMVSKLKAGGVGITLTAAADVAFLELGWNPGTMDQAEDRCHRGGQTRSVTAHYLLAEKTIDQTISDLIDSKRGTVTAASHGGEVGEDSLLGALLGRVLDGEGLAEAVGA